MDPSTPPPSRLPIIVGVTGHRDIVLAPHDPSLPAPRVAIEKELRALLTDFPHSPVLLVSGLAEGADSVAAEVALALADEPAFREPDGRPRIGLVSALPLPLELCAADFHDPNHVATVERLKARAVTTVDVWGAVAPQFDSLDSASRRAALDRSYVALGAYLARHCHLLLALWNGKPKGSRMEGGTADVVDWFEKGTPGERRGLRCIRIPCERESDPACEPMDHVRTEREKRETDAVLASLDERNRDASRQGAGGSASDSILGRSVAGLVVSDPPKKPLDAKPAQNNDEATLFGQDLLANLARTAARRITGEKSPKLEVDTAKTLIRLGSLEEARAALRRIDSLDELDPSRRREVYGLRASAHKAAALSMRPGHRRERLERLALASYRRAFESDGDAWPAVALASMNRLRGNDVEAAAWAHRALAVLASKTSGDGWEDVTRAEAYLVLGRLDEARDAFHGAPFVRDRRFADRAVTVRQARRLLRAGGLSAEDASSWIARALPGPTIGVLAGHMIDQPGRASPRFPARSAGAVGLAIAEWARTRSVDFGMASAACGSDLLFHEALRGAGAHTRIVLPYPATEFCNTSVRHAGADWVPRFESLLTDGPEWVSLVSTQPLGAQSRWIEYGNEYLEGLALCKSDEIEAPIRRLAVWDGRPQDGPRGTARTVRRWIARGEAFDVIDPHHPERGAVAYTTSESERGAVETRAPDVLGLLTADATGFSRLNDDDLGTFAEHFLERVREVINDAEEKRGEVPDVVNTWGDGIIIAFADLGALSRCAFDLRDRVARERWDHFGLPADLTLRIALHAGPVRRIMNPVTGRPDLLGSHVSHVARLEPVTPPGAVFGSEGFAALQRLRCPDAAKCTLVGRAPWGKGYGVGYGGLPMYRVEKADPVG